MKPQKIIAVFTVLCMLLSQSTSFASAAGSAVTVVTPCNVICVNPLYADVISEADLVSAADAPVALSDSDGYFTTVAEAGAFLREGMKARLPVVEIHYQTDTYSDELGNALFTSFMDTALEHTGNPTEGDYIRWQYAGYQGSMSGSTSGGTYYLTFTYTITYYSDTEQETAVDTAVAGLLGGLDLSGGDYEKICAAYDWICQNITYDYENLEDDTNTLKYTAYAALIDGTAVCQGYAVLLYRLALEMGIDCRLISGIGNGGAHSWNIIKVGDVYYNADAAWDAGRSDYSYFLKGADNFPDHVRDAEYETDTFHAAYPMSTVDYSETAESGQPDDAVVLASGACGENLTWKLTDDGRLTISGTGAMTDYANGEAPWYSYQSRITGVVIKAGVTSIGSAAFFGCVKLTGITVPESVTSVGDWAFHNCIGLTSAGPAGGGYRYEFAWTEAIPANAFRNCCSLTSVTLPEGLTSIGDHAFDSCSSLTSVAIPEGATSIGAYAFYVTGLTRVTIPESVTSIGNFAFSNSSGLASAGPIGGGYNIEFGWTKAIPDSVFYSSSLTSVTIPDGVTSIGDAAFYSCSSLTNITIPDSVTSIGVSAFSNCSSLTSIIIPNGVTSIEELSFQSCRGLKEIYFYGNAPSIANNAFYGVTATAFYPVYDETWTAEVRQNYGGTITWLPMLEITDGANSVLMTGGTGELTIRVDHDVSLFDGILLDGVEVDPANYTVSGDSAAVTFRPAFLETLATGDHYVVIQFTDGAAATKLTVVDYVPGDVNGDGKANNRDAVRLMQYLAGWDVKYVSAALDVNGDGKVNNRDAVRLMQYLAGWDVEIH